MGNLNDDARWMAAAVALSARGRGRTAPNPPVGAIIFADGKVIGRGGRTATAFRTVIGSLAGPGGARIDFVDVDRRPRRGRN